MTSATVDHVGDIQSRLHSTRRVRFGTWSSAVNHSKELLIIKACCVVL